MSRIVNFPRNVAVEVVGKLIMGVLVTRRTASRCSVGV